jgi:uncharacterized protein Veg
LSLPALRAIAVSIEETRGQSVTYQLALGRKRRDQALGGGPKRTPH